MQTSPRNNRYFQAAGLADSQPRPPVELRQNGRRTVEDRPIYSYFVQEQNDNTVVDSAPLPPTPPPPRGWNKVETTKEVESSGQLTPNQRNLLDTYLGAYMPKAYVEWGLNFFGTEEVAKYLTGDAVRRGYPDFHGYINRGTATGFTACCGYAEMKVSGIGYAKLWKQHLCFAWIVRKAGVICTINGEQRNCLDALKALGFRVMQDWQINPNSGNKIMMLLYTFPQGDELKAA